MAAPAGKKNRGVASAVGAVVVCVDPAIPGGSALSLHDALPILGGAGAVAAAAGEAGEGGEVELEDAGVVVGGGGGRLEAARLAGLHIDVHRCAAEIGRAHG